MGLYKRIEFFKNNKKIKTFWEEAKAHPVTFGLISLNIAIFMVVYFSPGGITTENLIKYGAFQKELVVQGEIYRTVSSMFLHGGWFHLIFNMLALFIFGRVIEEKINSKYFATFYFLSGLGASFVITLFYELEAVGVGASGAIFGLIGFFFWLTFFKKEAISKTYKRTVYEILILNAIITILFSNISTSAHLGGLIVGALLASMITKNDKDLYIETPAEKIRREIEENRREFEEEMAKEREKINDAYALHVEMKNPETNIILFEVKRKEKERLKKKI